MHVVNFSFKMLNISQNSSCQLKDTSATYPSAANTEELIQSEEKIWVGLEGQDSVQEAFLMSKNNKR